MKYVKIKDNVWHNSNEEMPNTTTKVEFMDKSGNILAGEIVIDMSGFYVYIPSKGWGSFSDMVKWRFIS